MLQATVLSDSGANGRVAVIRCERRLVEGLLLCGHCSSHRRDEPHSWFHVQMSRKKAKSWGLFDSLRPELLNLLPICIRCHNYARSQCDVGYRTRGLA